MNAATGTLGGTRVGRWGNNDTYVLIRGRVWVAAGVGTVDDTLARYLQPHVALLGLCHRTESGGRANTRSARLPNAWYSQT